MYYLSVSSEDLKLHGVTFRAPAAQKGWCLDFEAAERAAKGGAQDRENLSGRRQVL